MSEKRRDRSATCDYCGAGLGTMKGSAADRLYSRLDNGCRACDPCLLGAADDYPDMPEVDRVVYLRLQYAQPADLWGGINLAAIDDFIERAEREFIQEQVQMLRVERARVFRLHREGERVAMMEAARSLFSMANGLNQMLQVKVELLRDRMRMAGARKPRNTKEPAWHAEVVRYAQTLLATGRESHELTGMCARRYGKSDDATRTVLQSAGLVRKRKSRA